jgi:hypothetical protein
MTVLSRDAAELIVNAQQATVSTKEAVNALLRALERRNRPAQMREVHLSADRPQATDEAGDTALSIGIYNPNPVTIYSSINGGAAGPGRDSLSFPPGSLVVLPLSCSDLTLGADPAELAAGDAHLFVLRFDTVQQAFLGQIA